MDPDPVMDPKSKAQPVMNNQIIENVTTEPRKRQKLGNFPSRKSLLLMQLPCEIRCDIYQRLFASALGLPNKPKLSLDSARHAQKTAKNLIWVWTLHMETSILRVCKQMRFEALDLLYKDTTFVWPATSYKPESIRRALSPLTPYLHHSIRHIELRLVVNPDLGWGPEVARFAACCVQWRQSLPGLKSVNVLVEFLLPSPYLLRTDTQVCEAAGLIVKVLRPFNDVDEVLLTDSPTDDLDSFIELGRGTRSSRRSIEWRLEQKLSEELRMTRRKRVLHIARETLRIKNIMVTRRKVSEDGKVLEWREKQDIDLVVTTKNRLLGCLASSRISQNTYL